MLLFLFMFPCAWSMFDILFDVYVKAAYTEKKRWYMCALFSFTLLISSWNVVARLLHADRNFLAISWLAIGPILARGIKSIAPSTCNCREQLPEACLHPRKLATGDKWEMRIWVWAVWKEINKEWSWYCYREILLLLSSDLGLGIFICGFTTLLQRHGDWYSHLDLVHTHDKGASSGFELLTKSDISPKDDSRSCSAHWAALV